MAPSMRSAMRQTCSTTIVPTKFLLCKTKYAYYTFPMGQRRTVLPRKTPGPVPRRGIVVQSHVYVPEDLFEWAKKEGFSALVRRLLAEEYKKQNQTHEE